MLYPGSVVPLAMFSLCEQFEPFNFCFFGGLVRFFFLNILVSKTIRTNIRIYLCRKMIQRNTWTTIRTNTRIYSYPEHDANMIRTDFFTGKYLNIWIFATPCWENITFYLYESLWFKFLDTQLSLEPTPVSWLVSQSHFRISNLWSPWVKSETPHHSTCTCKFALLHFCIKRIFQ